MAGETFSSFVTKACVDIADEKHREIVTPTLLEAEICTKDILAACLFEVPDSEVQSTVWGVTPEPFCDDSSDYRLTDLRARAAELLYDASLDGRLVSCLQSQENPRNQRGESQQDASGRKAKMAEYLLEAASASGNPDAAAGLKQMAACVAQEDVDADALRSKAQETLKSALESGRLRDAVAEINMEKLRFRVQEALISAAGDGRLDAALHANRQANGMEQQEVTQREKLRLRMRQELLDAADDGRLAARLLETRTQTNSQAAEVTRLALTGALADGRLEQQLQQGGDIREKTRVALLQGVNNGELEAALAEVFMPKQQPTSMAMVPRPPADKKPQHRWERPLVMKLPKGSTMTDAIQLLSDADRRVGALNVEIREKTQLIQERDSTFKELTHRLQEATAELKHVQIDLQWHQEQLAIADARGDQLREDRMKVALHLEDIRQGKQLPDVAEEVIGGKMKNSASARSLASTACTGSGVGTDGYTTFQSRGPWEQASQACSSITEVQ